MLERTKRYLYEDRISQIKSPTSTCRLEYSGSCQRTKVIDVYSARSEVTVGVSQGWILEFLLSDIFLNYERKVFK